jgi:hypothetical protein
MAQLDLVSGVNPYTKFYKPNFGTVIGRPMAFNPRCDPNQRVYQDTLLKNNTIVRITPGVFHYNQTELERANVILAEYEKEAAGVRQDAGKERELNKLASEAQSRLVNEGLDMRYLTFQPDFRQFLRALQLLINRTSTSLFSRKLNGSTGQSVGFLTDITANLDLNQSAKHRGFNVWMEKQTSVSESITNSFTSSVFQSLENKVSRFSRELQAMGIGGSAQATDAGPAKDVTTENGMYQNQASLLGEVVQRASSALTGSKVVIPKIWDDSTFDRQYNLAFKFTSPYGDNRSVYMNVILPFLFLLTCAMPRQDGPSGMMNPFLLQVDAPGYFSTPMGAITSMSFVKGGQEQLWNAAGLPMVIEGSLNLTDLYSALSLPMENSQLITNFGTAAFLNNLVGATLYETEDPSQFDKLSNYIKGGLMNFTDPINAADAQVLAIMRWTGMASDDTMITRIRNSLGGGG